MGEHALHEKDAGREKEAEKFLDVLEAYNSVNLLQHMDMVADSRYEEVLEANGRVLQPERVKSDDGSRQNLKYIYQNGMDLSAVASSRSLQVRRNKGYNVTICEVKYPKELGLRTEFIGASPLVPCDAAKDKRESLAGKVFAEVMEAYMAANQAIQLGNKPDMNDMGILYQNRFTKSGFNNLVL